MILTLDICIWNMAPPLLVNSDLLAQHLVKRDPNSRGEGDGGVRSNRLSCGSFVFGKL